MTSNTNVSEMLVKVGGALLQSANSLQEMQARLDIVKTAWNISLNSRLDRKSALKQFLTKQKQFAPNREALKGLEFELKRIIKQKVLLYPDIDNEIVNAEAVVQENNSYEIKAHFKDAAQSA